MLPENAVGLCAGRHELPVKEFIFNEVTNVLDFKALKDTANEWVYQHCDIQYTWGTGINQSDYSDVRIHKGNDLDVVVTGLTACTAAVMYACACYGVNLRLGSAHHCGPARWQDNCVRTAQARPAVYRKGNVQRNHFYCL